MPTRKHVTDNDIGTSVQAPLVSGTNIKTINSESLLGSGNIAIGGGSPGGSDNQVQYKNGSAFAGAANVEIENGNLRLKNDSAPATPASSGLNLFSRSVAGRSMPAFIGPSGLDSALQPLLARNKVGWWNPPGNATTVSGVNGLPAASATGTATARNVATTNLFTRLKRLAYVSGATAGSLAGIRFNSAQFSTGNGSGLGGFLLVVRFGFSALTSDARAFVGMRNATAAPTNVEPSTLVNSIGVGRRSDDTNLHIFYGGSSAQTPIDLGANFPADTVNIDAYELALFASPFTTGEVNYQVTRLNTGHVATGTLSGNATVLPQSGTLLTSLNSYITNNATATAVAIDYASVYIETDY